MSHKCPRCEGPMIAAGNWGSDVMGIIGERFDCRDAECGETLEIHYDWPRLVDVKLHLPKTSPVLAWDEGEEWQLAFLDARDGKWYCDGDQSWKCLEHVIHWLPLPKAPDGRDLR